MATINKIGKYPEESILSYDEYEGNTSAAAQTYLAFVYYHETEYGGYDAIVGVGAGNIYWNINGK